MFDTEKTVCLRPICKIANESLHSCREEKSFLKLISKNLTWSSYTNNWFNKAVSMPCSIWRNIARKTKFFFRLGLHKRSELPSVLQGLKCMITAKSYLQNIEKFQRTTVRWVSGNLKTTLAKSSSWLVWQNLCSNKRSICYGSLNFYMQKTTRLSCHESMIHYEENLNLSNCKFGDLTNNVVKLFSKTEK